MLDTQTASAARRHAPLIISSMSHDQMIKAFSHEIQTWAPHRNPYQVFGAFVEIAAITLHQSPYHAGMLNQDDAFDRMERVYMDAIKPYSRDELDGVAKLYGMATLAFRSYPVF